MSCEQYPSQCFLSRMLRFVQAKAKHAAAGFPVVSQEQLQARLSACEGCEYFVEQTCSKCGCPIKEDRAAFWNKLAFATEDCPEGKWPRRDAEN